MVINFLLLLIIKQNRQRAVTHIFLNSCLLDVSVLILVHLDEQTIQLSHLQNPCFVFFDGVLINHLFLAGFMSTFASIMHRWLLCSVYFINRIRVYIVAQRRCIKFFQSVSHFFFRSEFQKILKAIPLLELLVNDVSFQVNAMLFGDWNSFLSLNRGEKRILWPAVAHRTPRCQLTQIRVLNGSLSL